MTNSISLAASANPKRPLAMTACSSRDPMTPRRNASPLSISTSPVWRDMASRFKVDIVPVLLRLHIHGDGYA